MTTSNRVDVVMAQDVKPTSTELDEDRDVELPTDKWTVEEIDEYADDHDIDLAGAKNKTEKLAAIAEHPAE